jgi:hypothetical protein
MRAVIDFLMGRSNRLLRDMLMTSSVVAVLCVMVATFISATMETIRTTRQPLPPRIQAAGPTVPSSQVTTITRSVLDDPIVTGSVIGRTIVLDPCTGKEKK